MKFYEHENYRFEVTSELGDDFLFYDEWARQNLTEAEYDTQRANPESEETAALFNRWKSEQKILTFVEFKDGIATG